MGGRTSTYEVGYGPVVVMAESMQVSTVDVEPE